MCVKISFDDFLHLIERVIRRRLNVVALAIIAHVLHRFGQNETAFAVDLFPDHIAHNLPIAAVVEFRDEIEGNDDLFLIFCKNRCNAEINKNNAAKNDSDCKW